MKCHQKVNLKEYFEIGNVKLLKYYHRDHQSRKSYPPNATKIIILVIDRDCLRFLRHVTVKFHELKSQSEGLNLTMKDLQDQIILNFIGNYR